MHDPAHFPSLAGWEATRDSLHGYLRAISAVPRALAEPHPNWWHISLKLQPDGPATDPIAYPDEPESHFQLLLNLRSHAVEFHDHRGESHSLSIAEAPTASALADRLLGTLKQRGVEVQVERAGFEDRAAPGYDPVHAEAYRTALFSTDQVLKHHRATLAGETSPVQLWPHNFDLAFEWYGSRMVTPEGEGQPSPAQINFGFAPGDESHPEPYFYSNPWPFMEALIEHPLPSGARWHTESWKGTLLPYDAMVGEPADKLHAYLQAVYQLASPSLSA